MGIGALGDTATSTELSGSGEREEVEYEDESVVHHAASVGDVEVLLIIHRKTIYSSCTLFFCLECEIRAEIMKDPDF